MRRFRDRKFFVAQNFSGNGSDLFVVGMFFEVSLEAMETFRVKQTKPCEVARFAKLLGRGGDQEETWGDAGERLDDFILDTRGFRAPAEVMRFIDDQKIPTGADRLPNQRRSFDDERTFVGTRTAAPHEAPQSLNLRIGEGEGFAQSAARACSTSTVNVAGAVMAMSASTLRSTSMPAALRPAMKRL